MPSPFPGMDPFLESQGFWQDFHTRLLTYCSELDQWVASRPLRRPDRRANQPGGPHGRSCLAASGQTYRLSESSTSLPH